MASQIQAFHAPRTDALAKLADVLKDQGLSTSNPSAGLGYGRSMNVVGAGLRSSHCRVTPMRLSLEEAPLLEASLLPGDIGRYVFVGQAWSTAEPRSLRWQWFKHKLGSLIGFPMRKGWIRCCS